MTKLEKIRRKLQLTMSPAEAIINHVAQSGVDFDYAVTLTFPHEPFDHIQAERIFGVFMHYLNERCAEKRRDYQRKKNRVKVFAMQEGQQQHKRRHYHCALHRPGHLTAQELEQRLKKCWIKATKDCHAVIDIREYYSSGWLDYITKELRQADNTNISEHCYW